MEYVIGLILLAGIGYIVWDMKHAKKADLTGKHPLDGVTKALDVNKDGKVDTKDAVAAVEAATVIAVETTKKVSKKAKEKTKEVAEKVEAAVKKTRSKKTKSN